MLYLNVLLQSAEAPWLTFFMRLLSGIITEIPLCILAVVIFWSVDKKKGIAMALTVVSTAAVNSFVKFCFKIARPFDRLPEIKKLDTTGGYSFPSGHSQQASALSFTAYLKCGKRRSVLFFGIAATLLIMLSRMYLGMHSLADVTVGAAMGILTAFLSIRLFDTADKSGKYELLYVVSAVSGIFTVIHGFDRELIVLTALSIGAVTGYIIEEKLICYRVPDKTADKIKASAIGLAVILLFKAPFALLNTELPLTAFSEYIIFGLAITGLAPCLIKIIIYGRGKNNETE